MSSPMQAARERLFKMFGSEFVIGLNTRAKTRTIVKCRRVAVAFLRERGFSYPECAAVVGMGGHSTARGAMDHIGPRSSWSDRAEMVCKSFERSFREGMALVPEIGISGGLDLYADMAWKEVSNGKVGRGRCEATRTEGALPEVRAARAE